MKTKPPFPSSLLFAASALMLVILSLACSLGAPTAAAPQPVSAETEDAGFPTDTPSPAPNALPTGTVEDLVSHCPTAEEIASVNADLTLQFDADPTAGVLVCTAADGSADLTRLQERAYQAVLMMKKIPFDQPLPWTDLPLYDWFVHAIDGIRFRGDIETSGCCDPANFINVQTANLSALQTNRWLDPSMGSGLRDLMVLFVHEARHNEGYLHTCGENSNMDNTAAEMGAWGVQYQLEMWLAYHTDRNFYRSLDTAPTYYQEMSLGSANFLRETRFCAEPAATPGPTPTLFP